MSMGRIDTEPDGWRVWVPISEPSRMTTFIPPDPELETDGRRQWLDTEPPDIIANADWVEPEELWSDFAFTDDRGMMSLYDVKQGTVGDCWFLAVVTTLFWCDPDMMHDMFDVDEKRGVYTFRFCVEGGRRVDVSVDRLIPCINGAPIGCRPCAWHGVVGIWPILLEKALAKLMGGYHKMNGGLATTAFMLLVCPARRAYSIMERTQHSKSLHNPKDLWNLLVRHKRAKGFFALSFRDGEEGRGLIPHHAYGLLSVCKVTMKTGGTVRLVRIHNPWGNCVEWKGRWCDTDVASWSLEIKDPRVGETNTIRDHLHHTVSPDGTFFMHIRHVARYIQRLDVAPST
jgi:calpain